MASVEGISQFVQTRQGFSSKIAQGMRKKSKARTFSGRSAVHCLSSVKKLVI